MADANVENNITVTVVSNGIGAAASAIASQIAVVNAASPTISGGLAVAKMSIVSVAAETLGVVIAVQSGDPDRIGSASAAAIGSIVAALAAGAITGAKTLIIVRDADWIEVKWHRWQCVTGLGMASI